MKSLKTLALAAALSLPGLAAWAQPAQTPQPCTAFPTALQEYVCTCTGGEMGSAWGSGPYTADSNICVAARHAGVVGAAGGTVHALARPGQESYTGSAANGVTSSNWGRYGASFDVTAPATAAACGAFPNGAAEHTCSCTGSETGSVWGSGPYTADSNICVAARHAGAVGTSGGTVTSYGIAGQASYAGTSANGVTTSNWGSYGASFVFRASGAGTTVPGGQATAACGAFPGGSGPYVCGCTGSETGSVWGSGPYTADSNLCVAARHAGMIGPSGGTITVLGIGGQSAYSGSSANGVTTSNWGSYGSSVIFSRN